jgi:hypothetical protein
MKNPAVDGLDFNPSRIELNILLRFFQGHPSASKPYYHHPIFEQMQGFRYSLTTN